MSSSISSLGIGSGVLTADVIDQLKEADESRMVKPLENKITTNNQKQDAYKLLESLMKTFKASASALSYDTMFEKKSVNVSGKSEVTVEAGSSAESFTLETTTLAKKDITKFGAVASKATEVASTDGTLEIKIGSDPLNPDKTLNINYTAGMTLSDLSQAITDQAGNDVSSSILQTGDGAFSLVLTSKTTGENQAMSISDTSGNLNADLFGAGYEKVQSATNAAFKYNGIEMSRSSNEIDDLILGTKIKLKQEGDFSNVEVSQDKEEITGEMQQFVDSYNTLMTNLHDMTLKDEKTGAEGVFNGDSFIKSISRDLISTITSLNSNNNSLVNYGIDLDRSGTMSFNKATFEKELDADPQGVKKLFTGSVSLDGQKNEGLFVSIDDKLKSYTGFGKLLNNFESSLKNDATNLSESYASAKASLDTRYDIMTKRFTAYDGMISRLNAQFSSLQMMINAEANSK